MGLQKEFEKMTRLILLLLIICLTGCSVSRKRQDICGTYVYDVVGVHHFITLNADSTFYRRDSVNLHLTSYDIRCTGTWSIVDQKYLVFDCTKGHENFNDSLACIECYVDYDYIDWDGNYRYVDNRFKIKHGHLTYGRYGKAKLKRIKTSRNKVKGMKASDYFGAKRKVLAKDK